MRAFRLITLLPLVFGISAFATNPPKAAKKKPKAKITKPTLYIVGYSHLDTQWCWTMPQVIGEFLPNTLHENFALFEKYPSYVFNWTGSNRYRLMKEYYPADYAKLKKFVASGNWFPAGSSIEEGDVNAPSGESLIRQVMYGNEFFRKEFGVASEEFMLPDCFGFPASLPTILAHCGIKGFSTQKLTWGSAVGIPFNVGVWKGTDGSYVVAALNPGSYGDEIHKDPATDPDWISRIEQDAAKSGVPTDYRYYGVGDRGGAPDEESVKTVVNAVKTGGPLNIFAGRADQMFNDLSPEQVASLPVYQGDLELTQHSAGSLTSEAEQKRWNRKNELLGDATEKASVAADWVGSLPYDKARITDAWLRFLPGQFHDLMAGTALPKAYNYTWNDEIIAQNEFSDTLTSAVGGVSKALDTAGPGEAVVVYNPLSVERNDVVEVDLPMASRAAQFVAVGPDGTAEKTQLVSRDGDRAKLLFLAKVPSVGFSVYHIVGTGGMGAMQPSPLKITRSRQGHNLLENSRYVVKLNGEGNVWSIFDKSVGKELLSAPIRLAFQHENPRDFPAWNMDWSDQKLPPRGYVDGPATIKIVESGPLRVALQVTRHSEGSVFVETVRLSSGDAANRVEFSDKIDWKGKECALKAVFPLAASNPMATYNWGPGTIQRGNDDPKKYEVASHQWFDLTDKGGSYGVTVLDDTKQGSDKPDDSTLRLTLLYTPGVAGGYQHQATQDWGRHTMLFGLMGHKGDWRDGGSQWEAEEMNQPLLAFETSAHPGALGKAFSVAHVSSPDVEIGALKVAENGNDLIVRLNELNASSERVKVGFATKVVGAKEVDGQERPIGPAAVEGGDLVVDMTPYHPRAFQLHLSESDHRLAAPKSTPVALPFDTDVTTPGPHVADGAFDNQQRSMPGDLLRSEIVSGGVRFKLGSSSGGKNALVCNGQTIDLPEGKSRRLYLLAASDDGDTVADFKTDGVSVPIRIQAWDGYVGQWDNRLWGGEVPKLAYDWHNPIVGLEPGFIKRDPVAWYADHRRLADGSDDPYAFCYLFRYSINIPDGVTTVTLPSNEKVRIMAASIGSQDFIRPIQPLYDVLERTNMPGPSITPEGGEYHDSLKVSLDHSFYWTPADQLRYTLDGSDPGPTSPIYQGPVWVRQDAVLKVADVDSHGKTGVVSTAQFKVNDTTPASIVSASAMAGSKIVKLVLSEPVVSGDAANPGNYSIDPSRPVQSAEISADGMGVTLHLGEPVTPGTTYTLNVQGLRDFSPNANATHAMAQIQPATPALTADGKPGSVRAPQLPTKAGAKWTINFFTYMTQQPGDLSLLAGFGSGGDENGAERYIIQHNGHIYFWGSNIDIESDQAYDLNRWQMITATYDGQTLRLYKDGKEIVHDGAAFADARPVARIAPPAPWEYGHRFDGKIAGLTIWSEALSREELQELLKATPK